MVNDIFVNMSPYVAHPLNENTLDENIEVFYSEPTNNIYTAKFKRTKIEQKNCFCEVI